MTQGPGMTAEHLQDLVRAFAGMPMGQPQAIHELLEKALQVLTSADTSAAAKAITCFVGQVLLYLGSFLFAPASHRETGLQPENNFICWQQVDLQFLTEHLLRSCIVKCLLSSDSMKPGRVKCHANMN